MKLTSIAKPAKRTAQASQGFRGFSTFQQAPQPNTYATHKSQRRGTLPALQRAALPNRPLSRDTRKRAKCPKTHRHSDPRSTFSTWACKNTRQYSFVCTCLNLTNATDDRLFAARCTRHHHHHHLSWHKVSITSTAPSQKFITAFQHIPKHNTIDGSNPTWVGTLSIRSRK